ncbi:MAG: HPr-rel-A system PqqD family protein [Candidatus Hydromicrobium americanum]|nr:MAG: HPr-rel-A system PqqD family protein [Candidatus Hydromicrobium americanum]
MNNNYEPMAQFKRLAISETGFVFDPQTGYSYLVNNTGVEILNCLKKELSEKEIIEHITKNYDVEEDQVERDYESFILRLKDYGLYKEELKENGVEKQKTKEK